MRPSHHVKLSSSCRPQPEPLRVRSLRLPDLLLVNYVGEQELQDGASPSDGHNLTLLADKRHNAQVVQLWQTTAKTPEAQLLLLLLFCKREQSTYQL